MANPFLVSSLRMEKERSHMTERMLNLTLEIIYLLTGENYIAFKLYDGLVAPNLKKTQSPFSDPPPSLTPERNHEQKIGEVAQKMIELLTGEVPIRCQDGSGGNKDVYIMASQPALTSPDGSRNGKPPERCPRPLYSHRNSTQGHKKIPHKDQANRHVVIKIKDEEDPYMRDDEPYVTMEVPEEDQSVNLVKVEVKEETEDLYVMDDDEPCKEIEVPPEIRTDGQYRQYNAEKRSRPSPDSEDDEDEDDFPADSPEDLVTTDLHPSPYSADLLDRPVHGWSLSDPSLPLAYGAGETFPCPECGKCFPLLMMLLAHKQTHEAETPHSCPDCGQYFTLKKDLLKHLASHDTDQPYACSYCKKRFLRKSRLDRHEIIHTGHKPYSCSMCTKRFTQKANLARHEKTHTGEKPFACSECDKCFTRKATLIEHQVQMHRGPEIGQ